MEKNHLVFEIMLVITILFTACISQSEQVSINQVGVQLKWLHQAQFAGFYAADNLGYYKEEDLEITLLEGGPEIDSIESVINGTAQFGVAGADEILIARTKGIPVVAVATIYQESPVVYITLVDSGITRPQDFKRKKIRVYTGNLTYTLRAMATGLGITPDQYQEVILPSDISEFASGEVPIWGAYLDGLAIAVQEAGYEINFIYPDDYGVHFYGDVIFTTEEMIANNAALVSRFLSATIKGWTYAIENPEEVGEMVIFYDPNADVALNNKRMLVMLRLVSPGQYPFGWMDSETWQEMYNTLLEQKIFDGVIDVNEAFTMDFLQAAFGDKK